MSITKEKFGTVSGREVACYTLKNAGGMQVSILTYGGILKNICVPDKNGVLTDVILGRDTLERYLDNGDYLGALIGRFGNRIIDGTFSIDGKEYHVGINNGKNSLHGGINGFDKKIWSAEESGTEDAPALILTTDSPDGEEGFPGNLQVRVTYTLTADNALQIHYEATSDADTVLNMTNHAYFNPNGCHGGLADELTLWIDSSFYAPNREDGVADGEVRKVCKTPFDFRTPKKLGEGFDSDFEQVRMFGGYDHNIFLNGNGFRKCASLYGEKSGILMEVSTDLPCVQLYTSNMINLENPGKGGILHETHQAVCLETQYAPNSINYPQFASPLLRAGDSYDTTTEYRFVIR